jgi:Fe-S cluster biogenesis protein NfuA
MLLKLTNLLPKLTYHNYIDTIVRSVVSKVAKCVARASHSRMFVRQACEESRNHRQRYLHRERVKIGLMRFAHSVAIRKVEKNVLDRFVVQFQGACQTAANSSFTNSDAPQRSANLMTLLVLLR